MREERFDNCKAKEYITRARATLSSLLPQVYTINRLYYAREHYRSKGDLCQHHIRANIVPFSLY